ncbi:hypothetical protein ACWEP8_38270 [Streptomyces hydrogenans]
MDELPDRLAPSWLLLTRSSSSPLDACRWHLGLDTDCPEDLDEEKHPWPLLLTYPGSELPGGDMATMRRSERLDELGRPMWEVFARNYSVDDNLPLLDAVLTLMAPHIAVPGYGGCLRHEYDTEPTVFVFRDEGYAHVSLGQVD